MSKFVLQLPITDHFLLGENSDIDKESLLMNITDTMPMEERGSARMEWQRML